VFLGSLVVPLPAGGQGVAVWGGPQVWVKSSVQGCCHGQPAGRCSFSALAGDAIRAGMLISFRRMVAVVALANEGLPVVLAAARVRLNAMTARTSQAAFAVNLPEGRWAKAEFFRSAWTCSMTAWPRWVYERVSLTRCPS
jgi:hypothetical protein